MSKENRCSVNKDLTGVRVGWYIFSLFSRQHSWLPVWETYSLLPITHVYCGNHKLPAALLRRRRLQRPHTDHHESSVNPTASALNFVQWLNNKDWWCRLSLCKDVVETGNVLTEIVTSIYLEKGYLHRSPMRKL